MSSIPSSLESLPASSSPWQSVMEPVTAAAPPCESCVPGTTHDSASIGGRKRFAPTSASASSSQSNESTKAPELGERGGEGVREPMSCRMMHGAATLTFFGQGKPPKAVAHAPHALVAVAARRYAVHAHDTHRKACEAVMVQGGLPATRNNRTYGFITAQARATDSAGHRDRRRHAHVTRRRRSYAVGLLQDGVSQVLQPLPIPKSVQKFLIGLQAK